MTTSPGNTIVRLGDVGLLRAPDLMAPACLHDPLDYANSLTDFPLDELLGSLDDDDLRMMDVDTDDDKETSVETVAAVQCTTQLQDRENSRAAHGTDWECGQRGASTSAPAVPSAPSNKRRLSDSEVEGSPPPHRRSFPARDLELISRTVNIYFQPGGHLRNDYLDPKKGSKTERPMMWKAFEDCGISTQQKMKQAIKETLQDLDNNVQLKDSRINVDGGTFRVLGGVGPNTLFKDEDFSWILGEQQHTYSS